MFPTGINTNFHLSAARREQLATFSSVHMGLLIEELKREAARGETWFANRRRKTYLNPNKEVVIVVFWVFQQLETFCFAPHAPSGLPYWLLV